LIATACGRQLAAEALEHKADFLLAPDGQTAASPTIDIAGKAPLDHWLELIGLCPRLLPVESTVFVLVSQTHLQLYLEWAKQRNFPESNIICDGAHLKV
jgi:hypothetical protein